MTPTMINQLILAYLTLLIVLLCTGAILFYLHVVYDLIDIVISNYYESMSLEDNNEKTCLYNNILLLDITSMEYIQ
jgi:hypothetical protein